MKLMFLLLAVFFLNPTGRAAIVDTVSIYSKAMRKEYNCVVIKPGLATNNSFPLPVVYLLHGYSGRFSNWITLVPQLKNFVDEYNLIIVCPDGGYSSWYYDSPLDTSMRYETYISKEVPDFIDANYSTIRDKKGRAITGLSMGGHGGLFLGLRHPDQFGACGSMSGGVDIRPFPKSWEISKRIGDIANYPSNWNKYSVAAIIDENQKEIPVIIFDCGTEDFFYKVNRALHEKMLRLNIPHEYIERPGKHDWAYWGNAVQYQLLFFSNYFSKSAAKEK